MARTLRGWHNRCLEPRSKLRMFPLVPHLQTVLHPEGWHGRGVRPPYFEGWYFKIVDAAGRRPLAFIPGIHLAADPRRSEAFVQVVDGARGRGHMLRFPADAFRAAPNRLDVRVGDSRFSAGGLSLELDRPGLRVRGDVRFGPLAPWPVSLAAPGAMGWYGWVPWMECYHGVCSLDHAAEGWVELDGERVELGRGRGYVEKDWGRRFPAHWVWIQSNAFATEGTSVTASLARIPWRGRSFPGLLVGVRHQGRFLRMTTYTGARVARLAVDARAVHLTVEHPEGRLELEADRGRPARILGPTDAGMDREVHEALGAEVRVRLTDPAGRVLLEDTGRHAGVEVQGDMSALVD